MCGRKSRIGAKGILLLLVLCLLVSPAYSAGYLAELLGARYRAVTSSQPSQEPQQPSLENVEEKKVEMNPQQVLESLQEGQQKLSGMTETELSERLNNLTTALEMVSSDLDSRLIQFNGSVENLRTQLENLKGDAQISDVMYDEALESLNQLAVSNAQLADEANYNAGYIAGMEKKEKQTKFFGNVGGVIGFQNSNPTWGLTTNMGLKMGHGLMLGTGISYMFGSFTEPKFTWDLDRMSINVTCGWEW